MDVTRDMVRDIVLANTYRSLEFLDLKDIDTSSRFDDLGAASLDIITIVSDSMRELKVKVPVEQLNKVANIDALIDALTAAVNAIRGG